MIDLPFRPDSAALVGRQKECERLATLVEAARGGCGGALVVRGEPGIGKTALLEAASATPGFEVLRCAGVEFEMELAFGALHQLCAPLMDRLGRLPRPQQDALSTIFGLREGEAPNRFLVGLAVLTLLSEVAGRRPLICVVDDAHWLDHASAQVLGFVAHRIGSEPVALIFACREPDDRQELARLPEVLIGGLGQADARALLASQLHAAVDEGVHERVIAEARGNPLALLELSHSIGPAELSGGFAGSDGRYVLPPFERSLQRRLKDLPRPTLRLLLVAAVEPVGDLALLCRAAGLLGVGIEAAAPAQAAGLVDIGVALRFRHPLVRSAIYRAASPKDRRSAHEALAEATDPSADPDRRAWHRGQATAGPDAEVADELERCADRAAKRGGLASVAAFLENAAFLTAETSPRNRRALAAAQAKLDAGEPEEALRLLASVKTATLDQAQRAAAETLRARIAFSAKRDDDAVAMLLRAAALTAPVDARSAREIFLEAFAAVLFAGRFGPAPRLAETAEAARTVLPAPLPARPLDLLLDGLTTEVTRGLPVAAPLLRDAIGAYRGREPGCGWMWLACSAAMDLWDDEAWRVLADRQVDIARRDGALAFLPVGLSYRALAHIHAGQFSAAAALIDEAYCIAADIGTPALVYVDITLAAWRGDGERTSTLAKAGVRDATERFEGRLLTAVEYAQAVLFNGLGRYDAALRACRHAWELDELGFQAWIPAEFIEAAARAGRRDLAARALARLRERTGVTDTDWGAGVELRSRALLATGRQAESLYRSAINRLSQCEALGHLARARLLYGEWLRREGRRREAREHLHAAHEMLSTMGAAAFAERAARELRALGERPRAGATDTLGSLTPQELQIAQLVATGATSKEVAAKLFLSPRTVDAHLRSIFRKLSITSRRQLRDLPLEKPA